MTVGVVTGGVLAIFDGGPVYSSARAVQEKAIKTNVKKGKVEEVLDKWNSDFFAERGARISLMVPKEAVEEEERQNQKKPFSKKGKKEGEGEEKKGKGEAKEQERQLRRFRLVIEKLDGSSTVSATAPNVIPTTDASDPLVAEIDSAIAQMNTMELDSSPIVEAEESIHVSPCTPTLSRPDDAAKSIENMQTVSSSLSTPVGNGDEIALELVGDGLRPRGLRSRTSSRSSAQINELPA